MWLIIIVIIAVLLFLTKNNVEKFVTENSTALDLRPFRSAKPWDKIDPYQNSTQPGGSPHWYPTLYPHNPYYPTRECLYE